MVIETECKAAQEAKCSLLAQSFFRKLKGQIQSLLINKFLLFCFGFIVHEESYCSIILVVECNFIWAHLMLVKHMDINAT